MSKFYLLLILVLVILALSVGGYSFYQASLSQNRAKSPAPVSPAVSPNTQTLTSPQSPTTPNTPAPVDMISLTVNSPKNKETVSSATISVSGKTVPNADVSVNDKDLKADASGNFSTILTLDEGDNDIYIMASDESGNYSEWNGTVTYTPTQ